MGRRWRGWGGSEGEDAPARISSTAPGACRHPAIGSEVDVCFPSRSSPSRDPHLEAMEIWHCQGKEGQEPESAQCAQGPDAIDGLRA